MDNVKTLLKDPTVDVNWAREMWQNLTPLHYACNNGFDAIVPLLLAHPAINVNLKTLDGRTPFLLACYSGRTCCARLLLEDLRVNINEPDAGGVSPLRHAAVRGHGGIVKWWLASGRDVVVPAAVSVGQDVVETVRSFEARRLQSASVVSLLEKFSKNPQKTREAIKEELGIIREDHSS